MKATFSFCVRFSGLTLRFNLPTTVTLPECFSDLRYEDTDTPDAEYTVQLLHTPLDVQGDPVGGYGGTDIYFTEKGWLHIHTALTAADGCQVACFLCPEGKNILYYPASRWDFYSQYWHSAHLLAGERLLMWHNAVLLHSSVVLIHGRMVLFSGPSGVGKSTQAQLWKNYKNADIINGDRCVIMEKNGEYLGGGSPWCGTSSIHRPEQAPIAGIFLLKHSTENTVRPLGAEAFAPLYSQTTLNPWDKDFMDNAATLYSGLLGSVPVYELCCTPTQDAVELAYHTIFGKD